MTSENSPGRACQVQALRASRPKLGSRSRTRTVDVGIFCVEFLRHKSQVRTTAKALKIGFKTVYNFLQRPDIDEHMEKARERLVEKTATVAAKRIVLDRSHLDERLLRQLDKHTTHESRGDQDYYAGVKIGYQSLQLIEAPKVINNNSAMAGAQAGQTAFEVYEPQWLREKKAAWDKQLAEKHGLPAELSQG